MLTACFFSVSHFQLKGEFCPLIISLGGLYPGRIMSGNLSLPYSVITSLSPGSSHMVGLIIHAPDTYRYSLKYQGDVKN